MTRSFCVVCSDTIYFEFPGLRFIDRLLQNLTAEFTIGINKYNLLKNMHKQLVFCTLQQETRNVISVSLFYLGRDEGFLDKTNAEVKAAARGSLFRIVKPGFLRYFHTTDSQSLLKNYLHTHDAPYYFHEKPLSKSIFSHIINQNILKKL